MKDKIGLMQAIGIADAYGRPFEFQSAEFIRANNKLKYLGEGDRNIGFYTDDTQMSIAIAEHMTGGTHCTHEQYMGAYVNQYQMDPRAGYSKRIKKLLSEAPGEGDGWEGIQKVLMTVSELIPRDSNGCVMRCLPLGLYSTPEKVKYAAIMSATVTHATTDCILATQFMALMAHYHYHELGINRLISCKQFLMEQLGEAIFDYVYHSYAGGELQCNALHTASLCYTVMDDLSIYSYNDILRHTVAIGGDVDSSAALCMGLGALKGLYDNDLDMNLMIDLENGDFGRDYLIDLDRRLVEQFPKNQ